MSEGYGIAAAPCMTTPPAGTLDFLDPCLAGMSSFCAGADQPPHVAQQSRRERLRYQPLDRFSDHHPPATSTNTHFLDSPPLHPSDVDGRILDSSVCQQNFHVQNSGFWNDSHQQCPISFGEMLLPAAVSDQGGIEMVMVPPPPTAANNGCFEGEGSSQSTLSLSLSSRLLAGSSTGNLTHAGAVGPLGPFTGYATILTNSKFLKPAQELLDESCRPATGAFCTGGNAGGCFSPVNSSSNRQSCGIISSDLNLRQKRAKLLFLQVEISRRQKHYNQQIQMAASSFQSVAGLSAAMPFLSAASKTIGKHFRYLKSVISEELVKVRKILGEDCVPVDVSSKPSTTFFDETVRRQAEEEAAGPGFLRRNDQPIWKPQRGLPTRAVSVLRAWLFDHFLHPYPSDTDKIMLANQTGLSRNQISNWFINARVRVWKPLVEEIHLLETGNVEDTSKNGSGGSANASIPLSNHQEHRHHHHQLSHGCGPEKQWTVQPEKRTRMGNVAGSEIPGFSAYASSGFAGGISLTLGLRREEAGGLQQIRSSYFGNQLVREYVGT